MKNIDSYEGVVVNTLLGSNYSQNDNIPAANDIFIKRTDTCEERKIPLIGTKKLYDCLEV